MNVRLTAIALCVAMAGCAQLPDLELAKRARTGGDLQTAENNFRSLAELGYEDAELGLADVLVQRPEPERQAEGETGAGRLPEADTDFHGHQPSRGSIARHG